MTLAALTVVLALAAWALRRHLWRPVSSPDELKVLSRSGLTQRAGLALVSVSGRRLLIGYGEGAPALLLDVSGSPHAEAKPSSSTAAHSAQPVSPRAGDAPPSAKDRFSALLSLAVREPQSASPLVEHDDPTSTQASSPSLHA